MCSGHVLHPCMLRADLVSDQLPGVIPNLVTKRPTTRLAVEPTRKMLGDTVSDSIFDVPGQAIDEVFPVHGYSTTTRTLPVSAPFVSPSR